VKYTRAWQVDPRLYTLYCPHCFSFGQLCNLDFIIKCAACGYQYTNDTAETYDEIFYAFVDEVVERSTPCPHCDGGRLRSDCEICCGSGIEPQEGTEDVDD
jgi:RecJ-like exonuclease